jgi:hypothetical protein
MRGFAIQIGLSPYASENDMDDSAPEHHAKSDDGARDFHLAASQHHLCLSKGHHCLAQGDDRAASKHFADAERHGAAADKIAGKHRKGEPEDGE